MVQRSKKSADCHAAIVVEAAIEACLDLWSERVAMGRDDKRATEEGFQAPDAYVDDEDEEEYEGKYKALTLP